MKREIKFRAWDKTYKRMNYKVQVGNTDYEDQNYSCNSIWVDYSDNKTTGWMNADDKCIDLMQFTGLKDKNGKEIYEGDILEIDKTPQPFSWSSVHKVEYVSQSGRFHLIGTMFDNMYEGISDISGKNCCEIIGNIHENPELCATTHH
jgi:uncharacterized phage protein (TIGR01671 family)